jgi:hypothetical protein
MDKDELLRIVCTLLFVNITNAHTGHETQRPRYSSPGRKRICARQYFAYSRGRSHSRMNAFWTSRIVYLERSGCTSCEETRVACRKWVVKRRHRVHLHHLSSALCPGCQDKRSLTYTFPIPKSSWVVHVWFVIGNVNECSVFGWLFGCRI